MVVAVPPKAELEPGFAHWFSKLYTIAKEAGIAVHFFASGDTIKELQQLHASSKNTIKTDFTLFKNWDDFLVFTGKLKPNDVFVIISSRKGHPSHSTYLDKLAYYLTSYFENNSFILLYPKQLEHGIRMDDVQHVDGELIDTIADKVSMVNKAGGYIKNLLKGKDT
jgi:hypothetical protein